MGLGISQITPEQVQELTANTPFEEREIAKLLKRYSQFDKSELGTEGIHYETFLQIPELQGYSLMPRVVQIYMDQKSKRIFPQQFLYLFAALSSKATIEDKRELAFKVLDVNKRGVLKQDEMFRFYKLLYGRTMTDNQILDMAFKAFNQDNLDTPGQITKEEFNEMVSDREIISRLTVDLQLP